MSLGVAILEAFNSGMDTMQLARHLTKVLGREYSEAQAYNMLAEAREGCGVRERPRKPSRIIIEEVAAKHGVMAREIIGPCRLRHVVEARCEAMRAVSAEWPNLSYPVLGRIFHRDHSTVMFHIDKSGKGRVKCECSKRVRQFTSGIPSDLVAPAESQGQVEP